MTTTKLTRFVLSKSNRLATLTIAVFLVFFVAMGLFADPPADGRLKVLNMGLGSGRVTTAPAGIDCTGPAACEAVFPSSPDVVVTASPEPGSTFLGWDQDADGDPLTTPDCPDATNPCTVTMNAHRSLRPKFGLVTPIPRIMDVTPEGLTGTGGIRGYLAANPTVDTPAEFIAALPDDYKRNWILMSRSESLQTGTARLPRILLPSANGEAVFTFGMAEHSSYPGAHPNAIEYMQWDPDKKNFRFHEIVIAPVLPTPSPIPEMDPDGDGVGVIPARPRGVSVDDAKCPKCHSTRNLPSLNRTPDPDVPGTIEGTDGRPPGSIVVKNKPNWDAYDSWGGMLSFNRDRIYQGSVEAAAFRKFFDPWTWSAASDAPVRLVMEQLKLQPSGIPNGTVPAGRPDHRIFRQRGGPDDGHVRFAFDPPPPPPVLIEPSPSPTASPTPDAPIMTSYSFDRTAGTGTATPVVRGGSFVTLHHESIPTSDEGRGVHFFDLLGGFGTGGTNLNAQRIADELIRHRAATGSVAFDVRPVALAVAQKCLVVNGSAVTSNPTMMPALPALSIGSAFFDSRNGMGIADLLTDTKTRAQSLPRRKADIQQLNLDRLNPDGSVDRYLVAAENGLIQQYGAGTSGSTSIIPERLRQEVFRRPIDLGRGDRTVMNQIYVDREEYGSIDDPTSVNYTDINTQQVTLYRYFLEPLGISVDKWSMGVRGRSRTYAFADVFGHYDNTIAGQIQRSLQPDRQPITGLTAFGCSDLINFLNTTLTIPLLPPADGPDAIPRYTDVQRIFNKSCIECHGGLDYPPYQNYGRRLDFSEDEAPTGTDDRLDRSWRLVTSSYVEDDPLSSFIYQRITDNETLTHPYNPLTANENCPYGLMPCGGPPLSKVDIETIRRWLVGGALNSRGDPHIETIDGVAYDFQSAGEFVLLRGQGLEIQTRQAAVETSGPLGPNGHTGLSSCVSLNSAVAVRVGQHRITYEPNTSGRPDPEGLQLRIDGNLQRMTPDGILLESGGRIIQTTAPGGIQIEAPGGTAIVITPGWWPPYEIWYLDIAARSARATDGIAGVIPPGNWLPALPDGTLMGPRPDDLHQRYVDLYDRFENAWRVTDATSLFDYGPGTSTSTFTIESWPTENPRACILPQRPEGPPTKTPLKALPLEVAQQHCGPLVNDKTRANCIQDVMVTGEPGFAQTYLRGEQIERNAPPTRPELGFPARFQTGLDPGVDFTWNTTSDVDRDPVTYRHCVWPVTEGFSFGKCVVTSVQPAGTRAWLGGGFLWPLLIVLIVCLLLLALLILMGRRRPVLVGLLAIAVVASVVVAIYIGRTRSTSGMLSKSVSGLESGKAYYWKVIAEDGKGRTVHSEMRRFEIK